MKPTRDDLVYLKVNPKLGGDPKWKKRKVPYVVTDEQFHEIAAAEGYHRFDVDVEALREVVKDRAEGWPMGNSEIETLISAAYQVLAVLDGEDT